MSLPSLLAKYIVRTEVKVNKCNLKTFCKLCVEILGEEEGHKTQFLNKTDCIIQHFKKCPNFFAKTTMKEREEIFQTNLTQNTIKRPCKNFKI